MFKTSEKIIIGSVLAISAVSASFGYALLTKTKKTKIYKTETIIECSEFKIIEKIIK